jgi:hypothetical protein
MYIQVNENMEIVRLIKVGVFPEENGYEIPDDTPADIIDHIFDYKYISGEFIKKANADSNRLKRIVDTKINVLSDICHEVIIKGIDFNGEHYSLEEHDQLNLNDLKEMAIQGQSVLYHSDGNLFRRYPPEEFLSLLKKIGEFKTFHMIYFNHLKSAVINMTDINEVLNVNYGSPLSPELQENFDILTQGMDFVIPNINDVTDYSLI